MAENTKKIAQSASIPAGSQGAAGQTFAPAAAKVNPVAATKTISSFSRLWRNALGWPVKFVRKVLIIAGSLYAMGCTVQFFLPIFRPETLTKVEPALKLLHRFIDPALDAASSLFSFDLQFKSFNFMLLVIAFASWLLQLAVAGRLAWLEALIFKPIVQAAAAAASTAQMKSAAVVPQGTRMSLLREYAASKHLLSQAKKDLSFLSIDVVGSTKMKIGEDQITIEHAFAEYKKFLERIFRDCRCWKVAWTPDGVMTCFLAADDAATAGRRLLAELDWFNRDVHQLRSKFHVRCGMNVGEVMFPDEKAMEEISDEVIDVAGHMQKYADHDTLWISADAYKRLSDQNGFVHIEKKVDNRETYVWSPPYAASSPASPSAANE